MAIFNAKKNIVDAIYKIVYSLIIAILLFVLVYSNENNKAVDDSHDEKSSAAQIEYIVHTKIINFSQANYELTDSERMLAEQIVACEAGADEFVGQLAVAQCLYDSVIIDDVDLHTVFKNYGYRLYTRQITNENKLAVSAVFDYGAKVSEKPIQWFVTPTAASKSWHEKYALFDAQYGAHRFYYSSQIILS